MAVTVKTGTEVRSPLDVAKIRADFPILSRTVNGKPVVYLDNAATSQKPRQVIDAMSAVFEEYNANIHRGVYEFSEQTTAAFEGARAKVARFIGARDDREVIFVRNATEGVNLVAYTWGRANIHSGDRIISTLLEHHSDFVPWQQLAKDVGAQIVMIDVDDDGRLRRDQLSAELKKGAKLLAITHTSNGLGTVNPVKEIVAEARAAGATVLVDAAQAVPHTPVDVIDLDCDFLVFSGHKMLAPPGSGAVWAHAALLERMRPFLFGGDMIARVTVEETTWNDLPWKFEAGTMPIAEAVGLGAAVDYLESLGMEAIFTHDRELVAYAMERLREVPDLEILGPPADRRGGVVAFTLDDIHPHDVATVLDADGIAVRAGHHCAMPLHERFGIPATARASFYCYTLPEEIDALVKGLHRARQVFAR